MHTFLLSLLGLIARLIVQKHTPYIIGITGTVGKTTITTHVAHFLISQYGSEEVGYSKYHYNGEYGLPLTIIGVRSPGKNPFLWIWIFLVGIARLFRRYPKYLVLEYGIDHPGEMEFLLSVAVPHIAILSPVAPNHLEQFGSFESYRREKILLVQATHQSIVHESLRQFMDMDPMYYSLGALSDLYASHLDVTIDGITAIVRSQGEDFPIFLKAIGTFQIENILPLYGVAALLGLDQSSIAPYLLNALPEPGRSNILSGIGEATIIDGTYNGGYLSLQEGIASMRAFLSSYRIVFFLGDMRELGDVSQEIHEKLAHEILDSIPHNAEVVFYLVGPMMEKYVAPILATEFQVVSSLSSRELGKQIRQDILTHPIKTIVYAKGSQNTIFLEEGLKSLIEDNADIAKLTRQSISWMRKKDTFFDSL